MIRSLGNGGRLIDSSSLLAFMEEGRGGREGGEEGVRRERLKSRMECRIGRGRGREDGVNGSEKEGVDKRIKIWKRDSGIEAKKKCML